jgi:hypothetical protein
LPPPAADLERLLVVAEKLQAEMNVEALQEQLVGLRSRSLPKKLVARWVDQQQ